MTDLIDRLDDAPDDEPTLSSAGVPLVPLAMLGVTALSSLVFLVAAITHDAGSTDEIAPQAVFAWLIGSLVGLLVYAWFGLLDSANRSTGQYRDPPWRPRVVAAVLATAGWLAGSAGAFVVAEAVARR